MNIIPSHNKNHVRYTHLSGDGDGGGDVLMVLMVVLSS